MQPRDWLPLGPRLFARHLAHQLSDIAEPFGPRTVLVEEDVAEHDVRDAELGRIGQGLIEGAVVGIPRTRSRDGAKAEPPDLRRQNFGPQSVRSASRQRAEWCALRAAHDRRR